MTTSNPLTKQFLLAAKYQEIHALKKLQNSCASLIKLGDFVHQLQRERAMSNIYLSSNTERFKIKLAEQKPLTDQAQDSFYHSLKSTYLNQENDTGHTRLFNLLAYSLQSLDILPNLRHKITRQEITAVKATRSFTQLIASLLSIILEAADGASDPKITRLLVVFFNYMQGKEYAGQERACGAQAFATSQFTQQQKEQLLHLQTEQTQSFEFFNEYADDHLLKCNKALCSHQVNNQVNQLRSLLQKLDDDTSQPLSQLSEVWYEVCTTRIDIMHKIEQNIADHLIDTAAMQIACAERMLNSNKQILNSISEPQTSTQNTIIDEGIINNNENIAAQKLSSNKNMFDLILEQKQHIKQINNALLETKKVLSEQKIIHQAKYILIEQLKLTEQQAHKQLQKQAMDTHNSLFTVAEKIIELSDT
ncbi:nitrate- and nitrite sensing domain-containing protein [Pseudoalteromonas sp. MMG010]|uniref:nitrate- and nitrite sensing domain-containing protein n=1 Tax=Pseudoalteromonas sp. MMG010 TaxID=2822685 RepID=UPI001B3A239D|nr:nitrate- and nitrite sensing domain-containing protein [Pseudoalteromonas sp. MMG010]MBQ4832550.1 nitrate- and nitrite sensing domain-containing protein [Pseudoalteromonas sp. MMG010]